MNPEILEAEDICRDPTKPTRTKPIPITARRISGGWIAYNEDRGLVATTEAWFPGPAVAKLRDKLKGRLTEVFMEA